MLKFIGYAKIADTARVEWDDTTQEYSGHSQQCYWSLEVLLQVVARKPLSLPLAVG